MSDPSATVGDVTVSVKGIDDFVRRYFAKAKRAATAGLVVVVTPIFTSSAKP